MKDVNSVYLNSARNTENKFSSSDKLLISLLEISEMTMLLSLSGPV